MKKVWFCFVLVVFSLFWFFGQKGMAGSFGGADSVLEASIDELISPNEIYVFVQNGCPHCWAAESYLKEKHPDLKVQIREVSSKENRQMYFACSAKFKLNRNTLGTPLFCMGDNYLLGWDEEAFEKYLKEFSSSSAKK